MHIRWFGQSAFLLTADSIRVAIDPFGQLPDELSVKFEYPPIEGVEAELVLVSHEHVDHNHTEAIGGDPVVIRAGAGTFSSPIGEVVGVASEHDAAAGTKRGPNTIFVFTLDGARSVHLGDFGQSSLRPEQRDAIGEIDVAFIPVGAGPTIDGEQAARIVAELHPRLVVPMHYATDAVDFLEPADRFLAAVDGRVERLSSSEADAEELMAPTGETVVAVLEAPTRG
jgi:L-ascorbate metabolism protein UlaG (beta-lactamase superfamily)